MDAALRELFDKHKPYFGYDEGQQRITCLANGHSFPARADCLQAFVNGKKFPHLKKKYEAEQNLPQLEPFILPSKNFPTMLYCALTGQLLDKSLEAARKHQEGKNYVAKKERYDSKLLQLKPEPDIEEVISEIKGKKTPAKKSAAEDGEEEGEGDAEAMEEEDEEDKEEEEEGQPHKKRARMLSDEEEEEDASMDEKEEEEEEEDSEEEEDGSASRGEEEDEDGFEFGVDDVVDIPPLAQQTKGGKKESKQPAKAAAPPPSAAPLSKKQKAKGHDRIPGDANGNGAKRKHKLGGRGG